MVSGDSRMTVGFNNLKHLVVLMMENRSFDHMLGGLSLVMENGQKKYPGVNGLTGNESNPDTNGNPVKVNPNAKFQSQLDPDPDHHFPGVDMQIFNGAPQGPGRVRSMQGFVKDYFTQTNNVNKSHNIMSYFTPDKLPVLVDARYTVCVIQRMVLVNSGADHMQSRIRSLRNVLWAGRNGHFRHPCSDYEFLREDACGRIYNHPR
jgi:phospholipase C